LWILIPLVTVFLTIIYAHIHGPLNLNEAVRHMIYGVVFTAGVWLGCMYFVQIFWRNFPWEHYPLKHLIIEVLVITSYTLIFSFSFYYLCVHYGFIEPLKRSLAEEIFDTLLITYLITTLHEAVFFYRQWKYNFSKSVKLENQHLSAKFESLKTQINPHYLFNSLNNLVSIVDDNPLAVEYINNMSAYFRFLLTSRQEELVKVEEEFAMLEKYIYLHKIRYGDILTIDIHVDENIKESKIPPLTIQMLVENCIKHNVIARNKPLSIQIFGEKDRVTVKNNLNPRKDVESTGQGLNNIMQRYKYFTQEDVLIEHTEDYFKVTVPVIL